MVEASPRKWLAAWRAGVAWWASAWRISIIIIVIIITIMITRPKPAYGQQGLDWIVGPGYSFVVFSTNKTMETNQKPRNNMKLP